MPEAVWEESEKFGDLLQKKNVRIRISPNFYFDKEGEIKNSLIDMGELPICRVNEMGERMFF